MAGGRIDILVEPDLDGFDRKLESGLRPATGLAGKVGRGIGLAFAAGVTGAGLALSSIISLGVDYTANLNSLQAVTQATGVQMRQVSRAATQLGADLDLPATSAADAAAAMLELAKGGLSVDQAMTAAKGTLQLAAAAHIDAAQAAEIQASTLNQFGLAAGQANRVADTLANTANQAAGEITDVALALKYVGPIATTLGVTLEDTAAALGLLANNGILGENAGTALRGVLASLAAPSAQARKGLAALGVEIFDQHGRFLGFRTLIEQLAGAQARLSDEEFTAAAAMAFGREPLAAITALAAEGGPAFTAMATAVSRSGGAADVAAAKTKGLGGAIEGLKSQVETAGLGIFDAVDEPLEHLVRSSAERVAQLGQTITGGLRTAVAAGQLYGPAVAAALRDRGDAIGEAAHDLLRPLADGAKQLANSGLNIAIGLFGELTGVLREATSLAAPMATGLGELAEAADATGGPLGLLQGGIGLIGDTAGLAAAGLRPLAEIAGVLASTFADLPGPVQSALLALVAYRLVQGRLADTGPVTVLRQFRDELRVQQALAAGAGQQIGVLTAAHAAYRTSTLPAVAATREFGDQVRSIRDGAAAAGAPIGVMSASLATLAERVPVLARMRDAFHDAAGGAGRLGAAAGAAAATGVGLRAAAGGLVGVLGGPVGVALTGVTIGLGLLGAAQEKSRAATRRSTDSQHDYARALRESNGAIDDAIRAHAIERIQQEGALGAAKHLAYVTRQQQIAGADLVAAVLDEGDAYQQLTGRLRQVIAENTVSVRTDGNKVNSMLATKSAAEKLLEQLTGLHGEFVSAQTEAAEFNSALGQSGKSMLASTETGRTLATAMQTLADSTASADDRSRALKDALDALSGGQVDYEQALARLHELLARLGPAFNTAGREAAAAGHGILDASGGIDTTTEAGRALLDLTDDLGAAMAEATQRTFDLAKAQGDDTPTALAKAAAAAQRARDAFVDAAVSAGVNAEQALLLADRYGLIPTAAVTAIEQPGMTKAQIELLLIKQRVDEVPNDKAIRVQSLSDEAKQKLLELGFTVRTLPDGRVEVTANTQTARDQLAAFLAAPATKIVQIVYRGEQAFRTPSGSIGLAEGAVVRRMAGGGVHRALTPMPAGVAQIVAPNTWRVVGDRIVDDELYLPLNPRLPRSHDLLQLANQRMGYLAVRLYAEGGLAQPTTPTGASWPAADVLAGGTAVFHLYDVDGVLLGSMRGVLSAHDRAVKRTVTARRA